MAGPVHIGRPTALQSRGWRATNATNTASSKPIRSATTRGHPFLGVQLARWYSV